MHPSNATLQKVIGTIHLCIEWQVDCSALPPHKEQNYSELHLL